MGTESTQSAARSTEWYLQQSVMLFGMSRLDEDEHTQTVFDLIRTITDAERLQRVLLLISAAADWKAVLDRLPDTIADAPILVERPGG